MSLQVVQFPCLSDNYGYLVRDGASGLVAAIDPPEAAPVQSAIDDRGWSLSVIMNTHWHRDHTGGNAQLAASSGARIYGPAEIVRSTPVDVIVSGGDVVTLGDTRFDVLDTGGHTLGHVSYHAAAEGVVFVGDTLFAMGCGRLFEGTPEQMWASLNRLAGLAAETLVYCAHEYTAANARFALSVDRDPVVARRAQEVFAARMTGTATVPTTIGVERATNPFLRAPALSPDMAPAQAFAAIRAAKDGFNA